MAHVHAKRSIIHSCSNRFEQIFVTDIKRTKQWSFVPKRQNSGVLFHKDKTVEFCSTKTKQWSFVPQRQNSGVLFHKDKTVEFCSKGQNSGVLFQRTKQWSFVPKDKTVEFCSKGQNSGVLFQKDKTVQLCWNCMKISSASGQHLNLNENLLGQQTDSNLTLPFV
jgi:hypothetical protein